MTNNIDYNNTIKHNVEYDSTFNLSEWKHYLNEAVPKNQLKTTAEFNNEILNPIHEQIKPTVAVGMALVSRLPFDFTERFVNTNNNICTDLVTHSIQYSNENETKLVTHDISRQDLTFVNEELKRRVFTAYGFIDQNKYNYCIMAPESMVEVLIERTHPYGNFNNNIKRDDNLSNLDDGRLVNAKDIQRMSHLLEMKIVRAIGYSLTYLTEVKDNPSQKHEVDIFHVHVPSTVHRMYNLIQLHHLDSACNAGVSLFITGWHSQHPQDQTTRIPGYKRTSNYFAQESKYNEHIKLLNLQSKLNAASTGLIKTVQFLDATKEHRKPIMQERLCVIAECLMEFADKMENLANVLRNTMDSVIHQHGNTINIVECAWKIWTYGHILKLMADEALDAWKKGTNALDDVCTTEMVGRASEIMTQKFHDINTVKVSFKVRSILDEVKLQTDLNNGDYSKWGLNINTPPLWTWTQLNNQFLETIFTHAGLKDQLKNRNTYKFQKNKIEIYLSGNIMMLVNTRSRHTTLCYAPIIGTTAQLCNYNKEEANNTLDISKNLQEFKANVIYGNNTSMASVNTQQTVTNYVNNNQKQLALKPRANSGLWWYRHNTRSVDVGTGKIADALASFFTNSMLVLQDGKIYIASNPWLKRISKAIVKEAKRVRITGATIGGYGITWEIMDAENHTQWPKAAQIALESLETTYHQVLSATTIVNAINNIYPNVLTFIPSTTISAYIEITLCKALPKQLSIYGMYRCWGIFYGQDLVDNDDSHQDKYTYLADKPHHIPETRVLTLTLEGVCFIKPAELKVGWLRVTNRITEATIGGFETNIKHLEKTTPVESMTCKMSERTQLEQIDWLIGA